MSDERTGLRKKIVVVNCLFRPGGLVLSDMDEMARASALVSRELIEAILAKIPEDGAAVQ